LDSTSWSFNWYYLYLFSFNILYIGTGGIGIQQNQGVSVSLSSDGSILAFGANNDNNSLGAFYIYQRNSNVWTQYGPKVQGPETGVGFGYSLSLNGDGSLIAVSSIYSNPDFGIIFVYQNISNYYQFYQSMIPLDSSNVAPAEGPQFNIRIDPAGLNIISGSMYNNLTNGSAQVYTRCY
jgi:hypothetical protein